MKNRRFLGVAIGAVSLMLLASTCKYADPGAVGSPPEDPDDGGTVTSTIRVTGVSLLKDYEPVGETIEFYEPGDIIEGLMAVIEPDDATNRAVRWSSSNPGVVMITLDEESQRYIFECVGDGISIITVTTWDGDKKASYPVMVTSLDPDKNYPTGFAEGWRTRLSGIFFPDGYGNPSTEIRLKDDRQLVLRPNDECPLGIIFMQDGSYAKDNVILPPKSFPIPDDVDRTLIFASSDESVFVCIYNEEGVYRGVKGVGPGTAIWSMSTLNGHSGEIEIIVTNPLAIEMVKINFGTFIMGSPPGEKGSNANERPTHTVNISSFMMSKYPITQEQYEAIMGTNLSMIKGDKLPVTNVSIISALDFCDLLSDYENKERPFRKGYVSAGSGGVMFTADYGDIKTSESSGYRLPTEAEWEYACRAGSGTPYSIGKGGSINTTHANFDESGGGGVPTPVGKYPPNPWGLYDMHGNVNEWVFDGGTYVLTTTPYTDDVVTDPGLGTNAFGGGGGAAVIRGGSYADTADKLRSATRTAVDWSQGSDTIGFRIVRACGPDD